MLQPTACINNVLEVLELERVEMTRLNGRVEDCEDQDHQPKLKEKRPLKLGSAALQWGGGVFKYQKINEVVYGLREKSNGETPIKKRQLSKMYSNNSSDRNRKTPLRKG